MRKFVFAILTLLLGFSFVSAQDAGPIIVGDEDAESLQVVQEYINTMDAALLSDTVILNDPTWLRPYQGVESVVVAQSEFYNLAFSDVERTPTRYIVSDEGIVTAEYVFSGVHTGPYGALAASDLPVTIPMVGIYTVEDGLITRIDKYYDTGTLRRQLGYGPLEYYDPLPAVQPLTFDNPDIDAITDNPSFYYGQTVTVQNEIVEAVTENAFRMEDVDIIDPEDILIIDMTSDLDGFDVFVLADEDAEVSVTGEVRQFDLDEFESELETTFDPDIFTNYQGKTTIIAESILVIDEG